MITDAHLHLSKFPSDYVDPYIAQSAGLGVLRFIMAGYDVEDWREQIRIQERFPKQVFTSFGLHPWVVSRLNESELEKGLESLEQLCNKANFIGETGMDYHRDVEGSGAREKNLKSFTAHLKLARKFSKPLVLHIVKAHEEALALLRTEGPKWSGMVHGFSGSSEIAQEYIKMGFFISIGTGLLDPKYKKLSLTVDRLPIESFIVESDSPQSPDDLNPDPKWVVKIIERISTIKQIPIATVQEIVEKNVQKLIGV